MNAEFRVHKLNDKGAAKAARVADAFDALLNDLKQVVPEGRYLAIVKTKLEEACFFAKKGVAELDDNQERSRAAS